MVVIVVVLPPTGHGKWTKQWAQCTFYPVIDAGLLTLLLDLSNAVLATRESFKAKSLRVCAGLGVSDQFISPFTSWAIRGDVDIFLAWLPCHKGSSFSKAGWGHGFFQPGVWGAARRTGGSPRGRSSLRLSFSLKISSHFSSTCS